MSNTHIPNNGQLGNANISAAKHLHKAIKNDAKKGKTTFNSEPFKRPWSAQGLPPQ